MRTLIVMLLAVTALAGCTASEGQGSASIYVKDAATDEFDEIHLVFTKVTIHAAGEENATDNSTSTAGWQTIWENATGRDIDLLNLSGNRAAFLGEANLSAGKYTQIRIEAQRAYGIQNGTEVPIELANSKLKVVHSFDVDADMETQIVLDFDLDRSVKQNGPHGWKMTPVIGKTIVNVVEDDASGSDVHEEGEVTEIEGTA